MKKSLNKIVALGIIVSGQVILANPLLAQNNKWLKTGNGHTGKSPIPAGQFKGRDIVVCKVNSSNGNLPGHLVDGLPGCFVAWSNSHFHSDNYSVLQATSNTKYRWYPRNRLNDNDQLVYVGKNNASGRSNYICRANSLPGRLEGGINGVCYTTWSDSNAANYNFDVLVKRKNTPPRILTP